jgi:ABC-type antimicrobial peptide transport system permease subunit
MGLLAAMLAVTGVFGMATYSVSRRLKELGIRIALGAQPARLMAIGIGPAAPPAAFRLSGRLSAGCDGSQLLAQIVYQATSRDPFVFAGAMTTMTVLGLLGVSIPAYRALDIDPARLLREE